MSKTVRVLANNVLCGDVLNGERVTRIVKGNKRPKKKGPHHALDKVNVLIVTNDRNGYGFNTVQIRGSNFVKVKRPKYNMSS